MESDITSSFVMYRLDPMDPTMFKSVVVLVAVATSPKSGIFREFLKNKSKRKKIMIFKITNKIFHLRTPR